MGPGGEEDGRCRRVSGKGEDRRAESRGSRACQAGVLGAAGGRGRGWLRWAEAASVLEDPLAP